MTRLSRSENYMFHKYQRLITDNVEDLTQNGGRANGVRIDVTSAASRSENDYGKYNYE